MNYIFIGNGITSLSTAFRLIQSSANVSKIIIVGKNKRLGSATLAAPAMLNSFCEVEDGLFKNEINLIKFNMSREASDLWPGFIKEISQFKISKNEKKKINEKLNRGTFLINNASADSLDDLNYEAIINALKKFKEPYDEVKARNIPGYKPSESDRSNRAIYIKNEGWINSSFTLDTLEKTLRKNNRVSFINDNVIELVQNNNKIDYIILESGEKISADKYILASGANVSDLLYKSNIDIKIPRIFYGVGVSLNLTNIDSNLKQCIRTPNRGLACGIYAVPFSNSLDEHKLVLGATNFISTKPIFKSRIIDTQSLLNNLVNQINNDSYKANIDKINVGWRPTSADTYPLIGKTTLLNLIIASGTKRDGFHLAPLISKILVSIIKNEKIDRCYDYFRPERELIKTLSRNDAINKSVSHLLSAAYQHDFNPGLITIKNKLHIQIKEDLERLHDKVGAFDWGIPTEMIDMYRYNHIKY